MGTLEEGWVKFRRFSCKEGFIDRWRGDCIDDPNLNFENKLNLNSGTTFFRLNGQDKWINQEDLNRRFVNHVPEYALIFSAKEIWEELTLSNT
ncbi:MAG: hypothetical protein COA50_15670 [Flavobacteriaceae bacterium]|nr:MAG: hypothetical protein COA50_15670 [Flavobacteriaceae bacterium]